jgi:hypothetical protein
MPTQIGGLIVTERREIFPFVNMVWNGSKIREKWAPIRAVLLKELHRAESELIHRGIRNCDVYGFTPHNFDHQINEISERGFVPLTIHRTQSHAGYDHRFYFVDEMAMDTYIYGVVADTYENAKKFRDLHLLPHGTDHRAVGELLGYPDCCMDFFLPVWIDGGVADPIYETAENTEGSEVIAENEINVSGLAALNRISKYFGMQLVPFFTCSFGCEDALKFADEVYDIIHERVPDEAEALMEFLSMPITWNMKNMITYVTHPLFRGSTNGYDWPTKRVVHWTPL